MNAKPIDHRSDAQGKDHAVADNECPECGSFNTNVEKFYAGDFAHYCYDCDHDWDLSEISATESSVQHP